MKEFNIGEFLPHLSGIFQDQPSVFRCSFPPHCPLLLRGLGDTVVLWQQLDYVASCCCPYHRLTSEYMYHYHTDNMGC